MSSIRDLYEAAVKDEHVSLAHYIIHLLQEGKLKLEDDESMFDISLADHQKVRQMIQSNLLGFNIIRTFVLKQNDNQYVFVFAKERHEAIEFFRKEFGYSTQNCHEYPMDFAIEKGNRFISFRELKKEFNQFPALIGFYKREVTYQ